jgi:hypothetical protein
MHADWLPFLLSSLGMLFPSQNIQLELHPGLTSLGPSFAFVTTPSYEPYFLGDPPSPALPGRPPPQTRRGSLRSGQREVMLFFFGQKSHVRIMLWNNYTRHPNREPNILRVCTELSSYPSGKKGRTNAANGHTENKLGTSDLRARGYS